MKIAGSTIVLGIFLFSIAQFIIGFSRDNGGDLGSIGTIFSGIGIFIFMIGVLIGLIQLSTSKKGT